MLKKSIAALVLAAGSAALAACFGLTVEAAKASAIAGGFGSLFTFYIMQTSGLVKDKAE